MKRSIIFLFVLLFIAIPAFGQDADTIVIRGFGNIVTFNPALTTDGASQQAFSLLFPTLLDVDSFTGEVIPGLTDYSVSDDSLTYTFTIRDDANWTDGTPITSADAKFVLEATQQETINTSWEEEVSQIAAINIIDDKTFEIVLNEVNCAALGGLGGIYVLPAHKYAADFSDFESSDFNMNPDISGGPYILEEWAPDEFQRFRANPDFYGGAPHIPFLINRVIGEQALAIQAIQAGEIDYTYFQGDLFEQIQNKDALQYHTFPQVSVNFLSLNWVDPSDPQPKLRTPYSRMCGCARRLPWVGIS
jgi:peptide/nickel transport system substrate-binding protein